MTDYKNTLNLPNTDFPMKANLPKSEPKILAYWDKIGLYQKLREQGESQERKLFILHDGPPYANGNIHIGHAINKTLKDIMVKSRTLGNFDAPFVPGWDCHGLPIELNVEKNIVKSGDVSTIEFIQACRKYAMSQVELQKADFIRLGVLGDWQNPYLTMDPEYEADTIRALAKMIENGHLQRGYKPVHWCVECGSALAEAEVEYKEKQSDAVDVLFRLVKPEDIQKLRIGSAKTEIAIPIWTTTPWTLPANEAVAVNPMHSYVLIDILNQAIPLLIVAEELLDAVVKRVGIGEYQVYGRFLGSTFEGMRVRHPFLMREVPVVLSDHVTLEAGTGAVHTAPAHGQDDYIIGERYKLPVENPVDAKGIFQPGTPIFAGEHVFKVNPHIIEVLEQGLNLLHGEKIVHSYAHCWRHKTPLIYRATPQWFISMEKNGLREQALAAIDKVRWFPKWGKVRIKEMVENRPDWCISRQRIWNTPIALLVHKHTGELHPKTLDIMEDVAQLVAENGIEVWYQLTVEDLISEDIDQYEKVTDTLDVWFDAGASHYCVLLKRPGLQAPADLYLEGSDQHRGWFQTSLLSSVAMFGRAPYIDVLTHGFAVDSQGRKMSKSLGNVIAPEKVINRLGADVLRLWVAATDFRGEMSVSDEILERASESYRRIRNTARFFLSNLDDFDPKLNMVSPSDRLELDQWAVDAAAAVQEEVVAAYGKYGFHQVAHRIHQFCTVEMGSFYLDIIKDRLYTTQANSLARRSAQSAIYHILQAMVRWIAPITSFTAEEIWQHIPNREVESVFLTTWYTQLTHIASSVRDNWRLIIEVREQVNQVLEKLRNEGVIGSSLAATVDLYVTPELYNLLTSLGDELKFILITSEVNVHPYEEGKAIAKTSEITFGPSKINLKIQAQPAPYKKCQRCWHRTKDVGSNPEQLDICNRCFTNIKGKGEKRLIA